MRDLGFKELHGLQEFLEVLGGPLGFYGGLGAVKKPRPRTCLHRDGLKL